MVIDQRVQLRIAVVGMASLVFLAALPAPAADDVRSAIEAANRKWEAAADRGDGAAVAALYTSDAQLLPPKSDFVRGTQAIGRFWQAVFDSGVKGVSLTTLEVESCGDTAHEVGKVELRGADGKILDQAKYVVVWKKEGGSWKLHRDIWTSSVVPAKK
jgi:uncharacterized protein (TIGR02246 family)